MKDVEIFCRALSVASRVRIIALLSEKAYCVGGLARRLGVTQSAVSQHLRILRDAELVRPVRKGLFLHYEIDEDVFHRRLARIDQLIASKDGEGDCDRVGKCGKNQTKS